MSKNTPKPDLDHCVASNIDLDNKEYMKKYGASKMKNSGKPQPPKPWAKWTEIENFGFKLEKRFGLVSSDAQAPTNDPPYYFDGASFHLETIHKGSSKADVKRWKAHTEILNLADSKLARCKPIGQSKLPKAGLREFLEELEERKGEEEIDADIWPFIRHFDLAFLAAKHEWLKKNPNYNDKRFEYEWNEELGREFSYSHFHATRRRGHAIAAGTLALRTIDYRLERDFGDLWNQSEDYQKDLQEAIVLWSGKQDDNGFVATQKFVKDIRANNPKIADILDNIYKDLKT